MHRRGQRVPGAPGTPGTEPRNADAETLALGPRSSRRQLLRGTGAAAALGAVAAVGAVGAGSLAVLRQARADADPRTVIPLWSETVAYDSDARRMLVGGRGLRLDMAPGTRLAANLPGSSPIRERAMAFEVGTAGWRAGLAERLGAQPLLLDLATTSLQDLWILSDALPAPVAGWSRSWRFIWPRDAAFCAVALARIGQLDRAEDVLAHLQSLQATDGWFEARYEPGTGRAPDGRRRQFDGTGLLLWATAEVADAADAADATDAADESRRDALLERLSPMIVRSLSALRSATREGTGLPPVSPDYWERRERSVTLGIMTATLTGLQAGARLTDEPGAHRAAETFTLLLEETFGRSGYQRYRLGGGADSALAFLDATGVHDVASRVHLLGLRSELSRPGGGIAPGASWREDGVSWTPSTSLLALALARAGEPDAAIEILLWLAEHRTAAGSLPEKVLFDGRPAEVAPLAWTAANVLLTLDALALR
ncbi:hypothetical protein ACT3SQ_13635 [Brachybacterium sp. AOP42-C2-15]|uniref:hypothetical protein n=1 Tax=unclassified Brachybacterium TaxID=2623841 RepID=UPI003FD9BCDE